MSKMTLFRRGPVLLTVILTGCVGTEWVKPGATTEMRERQLTSCEAQALKALPPDNVLSDRFSESEKKTDGKKAKAEQDTDYWTEDANEGKREVLVRDCMFQAGWSEQKKS